MRGLKCYNHGMKCFSISLLFSILLAFAPYAIAQEDTTLKPLPDFLSAPDDSALTDSALPDASAEDVANQTESDLLGILTPDEQTQEQEPSDLDEIPDEFIIEASNFGESCRNNSEMSKYFDCRCMAVKYLDKRIEAGPEALASHIQNSLGYECKDGTGVSGELYEKCLYNITNAPKHLDPEEYCSCYGNTFAKMYESYPRRLSTKVKIAFLSRAQLACRDPRAARRVYGSAVTRFTPQ